MSGRCAENGVTLIEVLVALVLGIGLLAALATAYLSVSRTQITVADKLFLTDSGQQALRSIRDSLRRAGNFTRLTAEFAAPTAVDTTSKCPGFQSFISGADDSATSERAHYNECVGGHYVRGDMVKLRYFDLDFDNADGLQSRLAGSPVENVETFFVGSSRLNGGCENSPVPALYRAFTDRNGAVRHEELVQGIEDLQLAFGVDTDADGTPNRFAPASEIIDWENVISVRIWILSRSLCPYHEYHDTQEYRLGNAVHAPRDGYRRRLFTTTVNIPTRERL